MKLLSKLLVENKQVLSEVAKMSVRNVDKYNLKQIPVEEIKIPVPWGHIAGKWWGPQDCRPVLGLHGWQDNAGTFDTLVPLLPSHVGFLAIDFPGHGLSSRIPNGLIYNSLDSLLLIMRIQKHFKWEKVSLFGHSMGSIITFLYSAVFPDKVDMAIGIDALKPHVAPPEYFKSIVAMKFNEFFLHDERNIYELQPPSYTYDEMVERWHLGTNKSVAKDKCKYLLTRAIEALPEDPTKFFFTRDNRLKANLFGGLSQEVCKDLAENISCPYMAIKAKHGPFYEKKEYFFEILDILKKNPENEYHNVDGTHHVHLNEPEKLMPFVSDFIIKHRAPKTVVSKL